MLNWLVGLKSLQQGNDVARRREEENLFHGCLGTSKSLSLGKAALIRDAAATSLAVGVTPSVLVVMA
jgi:hypothetical protein